LTRSVSSAITTTSRTRLGRMLMMLENLKSEV
jgi:hypothetical protein